MTPMRSSGPPTSKLQRLDAFIGSVPRTVLALGCLALMALVAWLDHRTGTDVSFSIFYLIPIALMAWYGFRPGGLAAALGGAAVWLAVDLLSRPHANPAWAPYWNAAVRCGFFLITVLLLTRLRTALDHTTRMALTDPLTGVLNGRAFGDASRRILAAAARSGKPFSLIYLDVDDFKRVNDTFGHAGGDRILRETAQLLEGAVRQSDLVARLGGDEFAVILPDADQRGTEAILGRICGTRSGLPGNRPLPVTFSVGAVTFVRVPAGIDDAIQAADALMYRVKETGKNACRHELYI